ncbi:MAG TPA: sigma-54 dependent transcriptional regulator [Candidatus Acidoferrales bacterium]|nr:sigma-54 dependent transcriptional regulator [Candidatus Acidoferrales bacterium]
MAATGAARDSLFAKIGDLPPADVIFGHSESMAMVRQKVEKVAGTNVPVLIQGESGTGKEVFAKLIHRLSRWADGPFVQVNCAAIPGTLLESELFGYQRGAFTGAHTNKPGRVELAHGGTLFLDEIAELDSSLQAKLLQLLQDGQFCRIGDRKDHQLEARVICATNRNLEQEITSGSFRPDLFYRINVISIQLPQLRDRREDIPLMLDYFLTRFNERFQRNTPPFSKSVMQLLQQRDWPGNIRELENCVARYVLLGSVEAFRNELTDPEPPTPTIEVAEDGSVPLKRIAKQAIRAVERNLILRVLQATNWNRRKAAQILRISYRALLYKIRQTGLPPKRPRRDPSRNATPSD